LDAKIDKLNEGLLECIRNYNDMTIKLETIENGNKSPDNFNSHWMPPHSHYSSNMGTYNNGMTKEKHIVPKFYGSNTREEKRWVNKIEQYLRYYQISNDEEKINVSSIHLKEFMYDWFLWWREKSKSLARYWDVLKNDLFLCFIDIE
jgi:hypothetical protein